MGNTEKYAGYLESILTNLDEDEAEVMEDLAENFLNETDIDNPDECVDVLLGYADTVEEDEQEKIYEIIRYIQEL